MQLIFNIISVSGVQPSDETFIRLLGWSPRCPLAPRLLQCVWLCPLPCTSQPWGYSVTTNMYFLIPWPFSSGLPTSLPPGNHHFVLCIIEFVSGFCLLIRFGWCELMCWVLVLLANHSWVFSFFVSFRFGAAGSLGARTFLSLCAPSPTSLIRDSVADSCAHTHARPPPVSPYGWGLLSSSASRAATRAVHFILRVLSQQPQPAWPSAVTIPPCFAPAGLLCPLLGLRQGPGSVPP